MSALPPVELDNLTQTAAGKDAVSERGRRKEAGGGSETKAGEKEEEEEEKEEGEGGEEEDPLSQSTEEDEVGKMLRSTLSELETALEVSRRLLAERDRELVQMKTEVENYKLQVAREIANKTKIAQSLDASMSHLREMEELTQQWQLEVKECHQVNKRQESQLLREKTKKKDLRRQLEMMKQSKEEEISHLTSQLVESKKNDQRSGAHDGLDSMTFDFLRQAVYHFLADIHSEDHLRSICSILKFTPQERKTVYSKFGEHKK